MTYEIWWFLSGVDTQITAVSFYWTFPVVNGSLIQQITPGGQRKAPTLLLLLIQVTQVLKIAITVLQWTRPNTDRGNPSPLTIDHQRPSSYAINVCASSVDFSSPWNEPRLEDSSPSRTHHRSPSFNFNWSMSKVLSPTTDCGTLSPIRIDHGCPTKYATKFTQISVEFA